jgi:hypothetical protein
MCHGQRAKLSAKLTACAQLADDDRKQGENTHIPASTHLDYLPIATPGLPSDYLDSDSLACFMILTPALAPILFAPASTIRRVAS